MYTGEYNDDIIEDFKGLYQQGVVAACPRDHVSLAYNVNFGKRGEVTTRESLEQSESLSHAVVRIFLSTINSTYRLLTCDGAGNIYNGNTSIYSAANLVDFAAINMGNYTFIAPIYSADSPGNVLLIYDGTTCRAAAGAAPTSTFTATETGTGGVEAGLHKFAVVYVTSSQFVTQPGPKIAGVFTPVELTSTAGKQVQLSSIPLGPSGTTQRMILVTKAGLNVFYYLAAGVINDNTTTSLTLDFLDSDLQVSADDQFDIRESIPTGFTGFGGLSLQKYKNRLLLVGGSGDSILVSADGDYESFNSVTGFLNIPTEGDGNYVRSAVEHYDVLYITKAVGIYTTTDNDSGDPSSWKVIGPIEGAYGAYPSAIGSITGSIPGLTTNGTVLFANTAGLFMFNGSIQHPPLSWKIQSLWETITKGTDNKISIAVDPFKSRIYVLCCTGASTTPNTLLVAFYHNGMSRETISWSVYTFPYTVTAMTMLSFADGDDFRYYLRLAANNTLYKLSNSIGADLGSSAINSYIETPLFSSKAGQLDLFRFIRYVVEGSGTFNMDFYDQYDNLLLQLTHTLALGSVNSIEYMKEFNLTIEKVKLRLGTNGVGHYFYLTYINLLHKMQMEARPSE